MSESVTTVQQAQEFDLLVIGGGSGGVASARRAAAHGVRVALVERDRLGGTCVIRGCVPKKLMMYASKFGRELPEMAAYGWRFEGATFEMDTWQTNKAAEIDRLEGIYNRMLDGSGVTVFRGDATIVDANTVSVDGTTTIKAKRLLIATGARVNRHAVPGIEQALTSDDILDLRHVPKRLGVLGAGYIALEFASILRGLGSDVTVFYRDHLPLRGFDNSTRAKLAQALTAQGITLMPSSSMKSVEVRGDTTVVFAGDMEYEFDAVLNATGRSPNTEGLGLGNIGVAMNQDGSIQVNEWSETSVANVYAVGDVTSRMALTPVAIAEGRALVDNLYTGTKKTVNHASVATATFTMPPLSSVGLTEEQAAGQYAKLRVYETEFRPMKVAFAGGTTKTYIKVLVDDASDKVVGVHMLGDDSPEIIQAIAIAVTLGATKAQFDATIAVHPTTAEEFVLLREVTRTVPA
ncbi:glutathione-disulfide reductase [Comamonadaceae bacterium M7527]|nr:glutathione-disulfide reductase [Comamonadaceae bacterium M7527]